MPFNYKPLWKMLIDRDMSKEDLRVALRFSPTTIAKMGRDQNVSLDVIDKICSHFSCEVSDVLEWYPHRPLDS